jgi:tRNA(Ile2) C34 agmatinyltransferase TiaS
MTEFSADGLIARLAPGVIDRFQGRGAVDFRVSSGEPDKLRVSILFSRGLDPWEALEDLKDVAERAGLPVADEEATEHSVSIAIAALRYVHKAAEPRGVVAWAAAAALAISGDLREGADSGASRPPNPE